MTTPNTPNNTDKKVRASLVILLLLLVGLYAYNNSHRNMIGAPNLAMNGNIDQLHDAVAQNKATNGPGLKMGDSTTEELKDAVAANPAFGGQNGNQQNDEHHDAPKPRGVDGGLGAGTNNPGSQLGNNPPTLSPSGPSNNNNNNNNNPQ